MGRVVYGYWNCPYCGNAGIRGDKRECPGCGRPRDDNTEFYMQEGKREYVPEEKVNRSPDWACEFCNSLNPASSEVCESCGSPRGSKPKTYFDMRRKRQEPLKPGGVTPVNDGFEWDPFDNPDMERAGPDEFGDPFEPDFGPGKPADYREKETTIGKHADTSDEVPSSQTGLSGIGQSITKVIKAVGNFFANHGVHILATLLILALIGGLVYLFIPKEYELTITDLQWERSIDIEKYAWVDDSGWM